MKPDTQDGVGSQSNPTPTGGIDVGVLYNSDANLESLEDPIAVATARDRMLAKQKALAQESRKAAWTKIRFGILGAALVFTGVMALVAHNHSAKESVVKSSNVSQRYSPVSIPLGDISDAGGLSIQGVKTLTIDGQLTVNNSLVLTPGNQPTTAIAGQLYFDQTNGELKYYNGKEFNQIIANSSGKIPVSTVNGAATDVTIGNGLGFNGGRLSNGGVLTLQGQAGNVNFTSGGGIAINGLALTNTGVLSLGGQSGNLSVGGGLSVAGGQLRNSGILSAVSGNSGITITNDGNGNITISNTGAGSGTVQSPGGTAGQFAYFTGVQTIADSLLSQSGVTVTVGGNLQVTGSLALGSALTVGNGGTGAGTAAGARSNLGAAASGANSDITSLSGLTTALTVAQGGTGVGTLATDGVLVGNGTSGLTSVVAGASGLCLLSTAGAPAFGPCPSASGGVTTLNSLSGGLSLANATGSGSTITIDNAAAGAKGIASFNATNFLVTSGAVNTVQDIAVTASPTFAGLTLGSPLTVGNGGTGGGTAGNARTNLGAAASGANGDITSITGLTTDLSVGQGGTGSNSAAGARSNIGAAASGANGDITSLSGLTTALSIIQGGTGAITLTANGVLLGNGTGAITAVAAGGSGLCLLSTLGAPAFGACPGSGGVSSLNTLTGAITLANSTNGGSIITINDAKADGSTKGIAAFNSGNFSAAGGVVNTIQNIDTGASPSFNGLTLAGVLSVNTVTPTGALAIGSATQNLTLQGAVTTVKSTNGGNTAQLTFVAPTSNVTYRLQTAATGTYDICTTAANCASVGGGVTTSGGTNNTLAKFTGGQTIADSIISDNGTTVTIGGNLSVTGTVSLTTALSIGNGGTGSTSAGGARTNLGAAASGSNSDITALSGLTTALSVGQGGTGSNSASGARTNLGAAASGANADITSITGLTTALSVTQGGTGANTLTADGILLGNGTGAITAITAGGSGLCLVSTAGAPAFAPCPGSAGVSTVDGLAGVITIDNTSGLGSTITIDSAKADGATLGIATFDSTNFSDNGSGLINTIQGIATTSSPTFSALTLSNALTVGNGGTGANSAAGARTNLGAAASGSNSDITALSGLTTALSVGQGGTGSNTAGGARTNLGAAASGANSDITALSGLTTALSVGQGGTGSNSASGARTNLSAAASGANSDITSLSGLTTALSVGQGGTGTNTLATNGVIIGQGSSTVSVVTASGAGLCLVSTVGAPVFTTCPTNGVATVNGLSGAIVIANATAGGSTITIDDAKADGSTKGIATFDSGNFSDNGSGVINTIQDIDTTAAPTFGQLSLTSAQATGNMLTINNTNASGTGDLLDLQLGSVSKLSVAPTGNLTTVGTITSGLINGQTISSSASFTGSVTTSASLTVGTVLNVNTITPSSALTIGATGQSFLLQGNASSTLTATNAGKTTTVAFQSPTANVTYNFATAAAGSYDVCTTVGNCTGVGGTITGTGTTNTLAKFTGSGAIGDSIITDNGSTVTIGGTLSVNTITPTAALTVGATGKNLTLQGATVNLTATSGGTTNTLLFTTPSGSNKAITLPNASGTVAVSASGPLSLDASGNLTCASCLTSGGGGGSAGVSSFNTLTGDVILQGTDAASLSAVGNTITISDASNTVKGLASFDATNLVVTSGDVNTIQDIAVTSTPTFAGLTLSSALTVGNGGTGANTAANARSNLGAAASGANSDITSLTGLTTALSAAQGGTGVATTPNNGEILIGNGSGYSLNTLTAGSGVTIDNSVAGHITIAAPTAGSCSTCASTSLGNLVGVAINTSLLPASAAGANLGSGTLPFGQLFLGGTSASPATNNFKFTGVSTSGTRTITLPDASGTVAVSASGYLSLNASTGALTFVGPLAVADGGTGSNTASGARSNLGAAASGSNSDITSLSGLTTALSVGQGGTGSTSASGARSNLGAAASGGNSDITSLTGLTTALSVSQGGTGLTGLTANQLLFASSTSAYGQIGNGSGGDCLVSNGASSAPSFQACTGSGGVASVDTLSGALTIDNTTGLGSTITIDDAKADGATKGIATFNASNFSDDGAGTINTIQDIATGASPTFNGLTLSTALSVGNGGTGANTAANARSNLSAAKSGANSDITSLSGLTTALSVGQGGTGSNSASGARTNLGAAASGANADITSLTGLTTALSVAQGGSGAVSLTANGILLGNGTSAITALAAGGGGECLVSTAGAPIWTTCPGSGGVTSLNGISGVISLDNASAVGSTITIDNAKADGSTKGIATFNSTNFSDNGSGTINTIQDIATSAAPTFGQLSLSSSQATNPMLVINNTNALGVGNLLDLKLNNSSKLSVAPSGNLTTVGTITSGDINGQTISSSASFSGSLATIGNVTVGGTLTSGTINGQTISGTASFTGSVTTGTSLTVGTTLNVNTITPSSSLTIGATGQSFLLQGNASSSLTATNGGNTTTVNFQTPTAAVTYRFATAVAGSYDICTTAGNCTGVGGTITGVGTIDTIPVFTGTGAIGNSLLTQTGGNTVNVGGNLAVTGSNTVATGTGLVSLNGDTTIAAGKNLTLASGAGTITQNFSAGTGTADTRNVTNSANSGTTTVTGQTFALTGTNNGSGANTNNALNFSNVAAATNNSFYGLNFGTGYTDILRYNGAQLISGAGILQNAALDSSVSYTNLTQVGALTSGSIGATFGTINTGSSITTSVAVQGGSFNNTASTFAVDSSGHITGVLSATTGATLVCQNASNVLATCTSTYAPSSGGNYLAKNANDTSSASFAGNLYDLTNTSTSGSGVLALTGNGTNSALSILQSGTSEPVAGQALIMANNNTTTPTGNLFDLKNKGASKFSVDVAGNLTTVGTITSGTINGQTISATASFSGTVAIATSLTVPSIDTAAGLTIGTSSATSITIGKTGNTITVNGSVDQSASTGSFKTGSGTVGLNGDTTIAAGKNLTLASGAGAITQNFSAGTGTADTRNVTNSANSGTTTVNGLSLALTGTNNGTGSNTNNALNFANVAGATNNSFYGLNFGTGYTDLLRYNGTQLISGTGIVQSAALSGSYTGITGVGTISSGTWQGNTVGTAYGGTGLNSYTANELIFASTSSTLSQLGNGSGGDCLVSNGASSAPSFQACTGSGGVASLDTLTGALTLANSSGVGSTVTINNAKADASTKGIATFNATNFSDNGSGTINTVQDIATSSAPSFGQLSLSSSQASNPMLVVNNTNALGVGNLLDLKLNNSSKLSVAPSGNLTTVGTITSGLINGQTISSSANFTGTVTTGSDLTVGGTVTSGTINGQTISSTASFTGSVSTSTSLTVGTTLNVNTITPSSSLTVGATGQSFLLQGNASSSLTATNSGNTTTVNFQTPTASVAYRFATAVAGSYDICTTAGNCTGVGGTITGVGTIDTIPVFTGTGAIGNSLLTQTGGNTVNVGGNLIVTGSNTVATGTGTVSLNGDTTIAAGKNLTLASGAGTVTQNFSAGTGTAETKNVTNSASSGTTTVNGQTFSLTGTNNGTGSNTNNALNFANVTAKTNNTFNGLNFGTGYDSLLNYNGSQLISGAGKLQNAALDSSVSYTNLTQVGALTSGSIGATFGTINTGSSITTSAAIQGGSFNNTGSTFAVDSSGHITGVLSATTGATLVCQNASNVLAACTGTYAPSSGGNYLAKNASDSSSASFTGNLYAFTNTDTAGSGVMALTNNGTNSALSILQSGTSEPVAGQALIMANNNTTTPTGNLIDLKNKGTSKFSVDVAGNLTTVGTITSGTINGQTISATASFSGTVAIATSLTVPSIDTAAGLTIGTSSATSITIGKTGNTITVNGSVDQSGSGGTFKTGSGAVSVNGDTTIAAGKNLTLASGAGTVTQNFSAGTGTAATNNVTDSAASGTTTVNGQTYALAGTSTSGTNNLNAVNFSNVTNPGGTNNYYGLNFGTGYTDILRYNGAQLISGAGILQSAALSGTYSGALTLSNTGNVYAGTSATLSGAVQGGSFNNTGSSFAVDSSGHVTNVLSATTGANLVCQNASNVLATCTNSYALASGANYIAKNASDTSSASVAGTLLSLTNTDATGSAVLALTGNGTNSAFSVLQSGTSEPVAGQALIMANNNTTTPTGNLIDLKNKGVSKFSVDVAGNLSTSGTITSGTVNGQTISATASFSGTVAIATSLTVPSIDTAAGLTIGTSSATSITIGKTGNTITVNGSVDQSASGGTFKTGSGAVSVNGDTTIAAGKNLTLASGAGAITQNFSAGTGTADTRNVTDSSASGASTVNGQTFALAGTSTSGTNNLNALNFSNVTNPGGTNNYYGLNFGTGYTDLLRYNGAQLISGAGILQSAALSGTYSGALTLSNTGNVYAGTSATLSGAVQGGSFNNTGSTFAVDSSGHITGVLSATTGANLVCQNASNVLATCTNSYALASGANYIAKNASDTSSASVAGTLLSLTNTDATGSAVLALTGNGTNSAFSVLQSGTSEPVAGQALIMANNNTTTPTGNLIDLKNKGVSKFSVDVAGNLATSGTITSGTINGQTISATASFSGTVAIATSVSVPSIDTAAGLTIGTSSATGITIGKSGNTITVNGSVDQSASTGSFKTGSGTVGLNGDTTVAAGKNLTFTSGAGTITQNFSATTGTADTRNVTNSANSGATTVNGQTFALIGTNNGSGTNANTALNFSNVAAATNNSFYGLNFGTGYTDILRYNGAQLISGAGVLQSAALSGTYSNALTLSNTGNVYAGTSATLSGAVQGGSFNNSGSSFAVDSSGHITGVLSATTGATPVCLNASSVLSACTGGGGSFIAKNASDTSSASVAGTLLSLTNTDATGSAVLALTGNGTNSAFSVLQSGTSEPVAGQALIMANNNTTTPTGNLIDLKNKGVSKFSVDVSGNLSTSGTVTSGTVNGQTISSTASFSGTVAITTSVSVPSIDTAAGLTIGTSSATGITIGKTGNTITVNGSVDQSTSTGTLKTGSGAVSLNGDTTIAAGKNLTLTSGAGTVTQNFSAGTGTAATNNVTDSAASGVTTVNGQTFALAGTSTSGTNNLNALNFSNVTNPGGTNNYYGLNFGTGYTDLLRYNGAQLISGTGILQSAALSGTYSNALTLSSTSNVYSGTSATLSGAVQGGSFNNTGSSFAVDSSGHITGVLSATTGANLVCQNASNVLATCTNSYALASGANYIAKNASDTSSASVAGTLLSLTNTDATGSAVLALTGNGTNSAFSVLQSGTSEPVAGQALIMANNNTTTPTGNLIDLKNKGVSKFSVDVAGNLATSGTITSGTINGQTISATASFSGTVAIATSVSVPSIDTAAGLSIGTGTATGITIGKTGNTITVNGNVDQSGSTGTLKTGSGAVSLNGDTTIAAGKNLTFTLGAGTVTQNFSAGTGTAATNNVTDSAASGVNTVNGQTFALAGTSTSGTNNLNALNFSNVTNPGGTNNYYGLNFGTGYTDLLRYNGAQLISGAGVLQSAALSGTYSGALTLSNTGNVYAGTSATLSGAVQGGSFNNTGSSFAVDSSGHITGALSATTGATLVCQNASSVLSTCTTSYAPASGANYIAKNASDSSSASVAGTLLSLTNTDATGSAVLALTGNGTNSAFSVLQSGTSEPVAGQALIMANNNTTTPTGNLIDLKNKGSSKFSVDVNGAVSSSGAINGQTISSTASFSGTVGITTSLSVPSIDTGAGLTIGTSSASSITIGKSGNTITVNGSVDQSGSTGSFKTGSGTVGLNGDTTIAAGKNLTFTSGAGTITQNFSAGTGTADTRNVTNSSASGAATVNGQTFALTGTSTSGTNNTSALSFTNVTNPGGTNNYYGLNFGTGYTDLLRYNGAQLISGAGILQSAALSGTYSNALTLSSTSNVYSGTSATLSGAVQGGTFNNTGSTFAVDAAGHITGVLSATTGGTLVCQNGSSVLATCTTTYAPATGGNYLAKNGNDTSSFGFAGNLYALTNTDATGSGVLALTGNGTNSAFSVLQSGTSEPVAGQALIMANNNTTTPTGNLIDLKNKGVSKFSVDINGAVSSSSTINGQTISSTASFSGTVAITTSVSVPSIDTAAGLSIGTGTATGITIGKTGNTITVNGSVDQSGSTGSFKTGSGNVTLNGDTTVNTGKNFTVTSGTTGLTGALTQTGGAVSLTGNAASQVSTSSGNFTVDAAAILNLGTTNATGVTIGNTANTSALLLQGTAGATYTIGTAANTGGIVLGNSTANNTIAIGNAATTATQTISIGTAATGTGVDAVTVGNTNAASATTLQSGTGGINLFTNGGASSTTGTVVKSVSNNSTKAFQIQNSIGTALLTADTTNSKVTVQQAADTATLSAELFTASYSFPATTGWSAISGTGGSATATASAGASPLSPTPAMTITAGATYQVTYNISGGAALTYAAVTASIGGASGTAIYDDATDTITEVITTASTANLTFTPTASWFGTISGVSVKQLTTTGAVLSVLNTSSTPVIDFRSAGTSGVYIGLNAGKSATIGNIGIGNSALQNSTSGIANTAVGNGALAANTSGGRNAAFGPSSLGQNTTGSFNTAYGAFSLNGNTTGSLNTSLGYFAGNTDSQGIFGVSSYQTNIQNSTAIGAYSVSQANNSIVLGSVDKGTIVGIGTTIPTNTLSVSPVDHNSNSIRATQVGTTVTASSGIFNPTDVGETLIFADGQYETITGYTSSTVVTVSASLLNETTQFFRTQHPGFQVTNAGNAFLQSTSTTAFQIQNTAGTSLLTADTTNSTVSVQQGASTATLGAEMFTATYSFPATAGWSVAGTGGAATATCTVAGSCTISPTPALPITASTYYQVTYTISGAPGSGSMKAKMGNYTGRPIVDASGTFTEVFFTSNTTSLSFTGTPPWVGTISNVSVKLLTNVSPALQILDSGSTARAQIRISGSADIYFGKFAGQSDVSGFGNTGIGYTAMQSNVSGTEDTALGAGALEYTTTGNYNTAVGGTALNFNITGSNNTAVGYNALAHNQTGSNNTALGYYAQYQDAQGRFIASNNVADVQNSTAIGAYSVVQSSNSIVLGSVDNATKVGIGTTEPANTFSVSPVDLDSNTITASQTSGLGTITASGAIFSPANVGETLIWPDGNSETITGYSSTTVVTGSSTTLTENAYFRTHIGGFQVTSTGTAFVQSTSTTAFQIQNTAGTSLLTADTTNATVTIASNADGGTLGGELFTVTYSFAAATNWVGLSGTGNTATATHTAGSVTAIGVTPAFPVTAGATYDVTYSVSGGGVNNAFYVTAGIGGANGARYFGSATHSDMITTTTTGNLTFTPSSNFAGTITGISVKLVTVQPATLRIAGSTGVAPTEIRGSNSNTYVGYLSGQSTSGNPDWNVGVGAFALQSNYTGWANTAIGYQAMQNETTGFQNVAIGYQAALYMTSGTQNIAIGAQALLDANATSGNIAIGATTGQSITSGGSNTIVGNSAFTISSAGASNAGFGANVLGLDNTGNSNSALGASSLFAITTGSFNSGLGYFAGKTDSGAKFTTVGSISNSTAIGAYAQVQASNSIVLGSIDTATNVGIGTTIPLNTFSVSPVDSSVGTAGTGGVSSTAVTGITTAFAATMIGEQMVWQDGQTATITAVGSALGLTLNTAVTEANTQTYRIHHTGFQVTSAGNAFVQNTSTTAFQVQDATGTNDLAIDTTNGKITIGTGATGQASGDVLILDSDTNATYSAGAAASAPTEVDGAIFYSKTNHDFMCGQAGSWETCTGLLYSNTAASSAVNTCTGACAAFTLNAPIPANYCQAGRVIHLLARGVYSTAASTAPTLAFELRYGTDGTLRANDTQIGATTQTSSTLANSLVNSAWSLDTTVICFSTAAGSSTINGQGYALLQLVNGASAATTTSQESLYAGTATNQTSVVTNAAKNLYIFPTWGASNVGNTITVQQLIVTGN